MRSRRHLVLAAPLAVGDLEEIELEADGLGEPVQQVHAQPRRALPQLRVVRVVRPATHVTQALHCRLHTCNERIDTSCMPEIFRIVGQWTHASDACSHFGQKVCHTNRDNLRHYDSLRVLN